MIFRTLAFIAYLSWAFIIIGLVYDAYQDFTQEAITIVEGTVIPDVIHAGDLLTARYKFIRNQDCTLHINRFIASEHEEALLNSYDLNITKDLNPNPKTYVSSWPVPNVSPGRYSLYAKYRYFCNVVDYIIPRIRETNNFHFTVLPKNE